MSTTPPEADTEYSRGSRLFRDLSRRGSGRRSRGERSRGTIVARSVQGAILLGGTLGALLLLVSEFTTLFEVTVQGSSAPVRTVATGSHHSYALVPIALLVAALAFAVWRASSRPALLAIGVLGVIALLIGLLTDLPDAQATGLLYRGSHYVSASSTPSAGLYMETLGTVVLLATSVCGFLLLGTPSPSAASEPRR